MSSFRSDRRCADDHARPVDQPTAAQFVEHRVVSWCHGPLAEAAVRGLERHPERRVPREGPGPLPDCPRLHVCPLDTVRDFSIMLEARGLSLVMTVYPRCSACASRTGGLDKTRTSLSDCLRDNL
jgi:hypothetical protein